MTDATTLGTAAEAPPWRVLIVDDDATLRDYAVEYLSGLELGGRKVGIESTADFAEALAIIESRVLDLLILDVYRGPAVNDDQAGITVLEALKARGFVGTVLFTAHPENVQHLEGPFVRIVGKERAPFESIAKALAELVATGIPAAHRNISILLDATLRDYMWEFVAKNWSELHHMAASGDFERTVLRRMTASLTRDRELAEDCIHPAEMYLMPPLGGNVSRLGDVRRRAVEHGVEYLVVIWPSCDLIQKDDRPTKVDSVICAVASEAKQDDLVRSVIERPSKGNHSRLDQTIGNRGEEHLCFLPGLCDLPDLLINLRRIEVVSLTSLSKCDRMATLASPFAEEVLSRFSRYIGRVGTPDLDSVQVKARMGVASLQPAQEAQS